MAAHIWETQYNYVKLKRRSGSVNGGAEKSNLSAWIGSLEQDPSTEQLGKDAPDGPHVDACVVVLAASQQLWGTVVLRDHLQGHGCVAIGFDGAGKSKVADLEEAVAVDQEISRLQVAMDDTGRV